MNRYELIETLVPVLKDALVVCNIGIPSQELFSIRDRENHFYMLGSLGLCSSIGLGLALTTIKSVVGLVDWMYGSLPMVKRWRREERERLDARERRV